jgi:hypothetical protein
LFGVKNANFFAEFFARKYFKNHNIGPWFYIQMMAVLKLQRRNFARTDGTSFEDPLELDDLSLLRGRRGLQLVAFRGQATDRHGRGLLGPILRIIISAEKLQSIFFALNNGQHIIRNLQTNLI